MAAASETDTNRTMEASYGELPFSHMDKETVFNNLIEELKNIATTYALNPKILTDAIADKAKFKFLSSEQKQANPENDPDQSLLPWKSSSESTERSPWSIRISVCRYCNK